MKKKNKREPQNGKEKTTKPYEDLTAKIVGDFGKWQLQISVMMGLMKLPIAWYQLNIIFMAPPQDFWCAKPDTFRDISEDEWRNICSPSFNDQCMIYDPDILLSMPNMNRSAIPLVQCKSFVYDVTVFSRTIVSDWDLVCKRRWLVHITQCVMMWGVLVGGLVFGAMADKFGRKITLMVCIVVQSITSFNASFIPWYSGFLVNWFVLAMASGGTGIVSFVMCLEVVSGKWRTIMPVLSQVPFGFGNAVMAGFAYWLKDWRKLEFALATVSSMFMLYWFWISESPRWLLAKGRTQEAIKVLENAAERNRLVFNEEVVEELLARAKPPKKDDPGFISFLRSKYMRQRTLLLSANWFCIGLAFYTFSQYLGMIGSNIFLTVAMSGIISTPGAIVCVFAISKMGRKKTLIMFQFVTAACFAFILVIPINVFPNDWPRLLFAGIGFAGMAGFVPALYLFSGELYPTLGRNVGVSGVSTFARIGSMIAPAVVSLNDVRADLPLLLLAAMSFSQLFLIMPLPETKDMPLPDTLEDAEKLSRPKEKGREKRKPFF